MKCEFYARVAKEIIYHGNYDYDLWQADIDKDAYSNDIDRLKDLITKLIHLKDSAKEPFNTRFRTVFHTKGYRLYKTIENMDRNALKGVKSVELDGSKHDIDELSYDADNDVMKCYINTVKFEELLDDDYREKETSKKRDEYVARADGIISEINKMIDSEVERRRNLSFFSKRKWF